MAETASAQRPLARSYLFVPATTRRYVDKAHLRGADAIVLDLEDSIPASAKPDARLAAADAIPALASRGVSRIFVRINPSILAAVRDLEAVMGPGLSGVVLPKCETAETVRTVCSAIGDLEFETGLASGAVRVGVRVETARGFFAMEDIAAAAGRIEFFGLGGEDFSASIGGEPTIDVLKYPKQQAIIAARAAGVSPVGLIGSGANFTDLDAARRNAVLSRQFGFEGATCIHPALVPVLNEAFTPDPDEVRRALRLIEAYDAAMAEGRGALSFEGRMIDAPVVARARRLAGFDFA